MNSSAVVYYIKYFPLENNILCMKMLVLLIIVMNTISRLCIK